MAKVIPMHGKYAPAKCKEEARFLAALVFEALPILLPMADVAERRKLAHDMLVLCRGRKPRRLTPEVLKRHSEMLAARPLTVRFNSEEE